MRFSKKREFFPRLSALRFYRSAQVDRGQWFVSTIFDALSKMVLTYHCSPQWASRHDQPASIKLAAGKNSLSVSVSPHRFSLYPAS